MKFRIPRLLLKSISKNGPQIFMIVMICYDLGTILIISVYFKLVTAGREFAFSRLIRLGIFFADFLKKDIMNTTFEISRDRVRRNTAENVNQRIDDRIIENIDRYSTADRAEVERRLAELDREWDIERALELTSAGNTLIGLLLGLTVNRKWLILSAVSAAFLVQHTVQGWCPPVPVLRRLGIRTKEEIDLERDALLARIDELNIKSRDELTGA